MRTLWCSMGVVAMVTLATLPATRAALPLIRAFSNEPVRVVVNTHLDADHVAGNQAFAGAAILAHANAPTSRRCWQPCATRRRAVSRSTQPDPFLELAAFSGRLLYDLVHPAHVQLAWDEMAARAGS